MFGILAKFFRFSGRENGNKFKLSIVIGLIEALASAMKIPAIMYILIGLMSGKPIGKYIGGSIAIMVIAIVVDVICKRYSTVLQTEGGYNASAFMRIKIAEHLRYLPMGYFNANSIGEISSITTNTMETLGDVAARVVMLTMQGILETSMIILMLFLFDWRIGLIAAAGVLIFFGVNSVMQNAALIRKRIRSPRVKVRGLKAGIRSNTNVYLVYVEDLANPGLVKEIEKRLQDFTIDGILDSGMLEQLAEKKWYSPFPQFQTTQRPDRAAMAVLEGRVIVMCDNSPIGLILPPAYNSFIRTSDYYYSRFEIATFGRILRYLASFFAMTLPGFYLAVTNFHTQILPTTLLLSFAEARQGVPFPAVVEVLIMELSFELLREAGVRLPGAMGNTIGIVGGLIIGQAAVEANLVSPIVVIVISFTALCSFAIPNEEFATAFRILKFFFIGICAWLGYFGMLLGLLAVLTHLSHLTSFGIPYLMPFVGADLNNYEDERDFIWRQPFRKLRKRPIYANPKERTKLTFSKKR